MDKIIINMGDYNSANVRKAELDLKNNEYFVLVTSKESSPSGVWAHVSHAQKCAVILCSDESNSIDNTQSITEALTTKGFALSEATQ